MVDDPKHIVARGYDIIYDRYARWTAQPGDPREKYLQRGAEIARPGGRALDIGCGTGITATTKLAERFTAVGLDISRKSVVAARRQVPRAHFVVGDMASMGFAPTSFDLVVALYSLIHVPRDEHRSVLRSVRRWLQPGGVIVITMGAGAGGEGTEEQWLGVPMYWSNWDEETNLALVRGEGFEIVHAAKEATYEDGVPIWFLWVVART